jgi:CheY-like chemotaxis protein
MRTVLVIDDETKIQDLCRRVLEEAGYRVATAANGVEGLGFIREHPTDLVICDIFMPEKDGIETIRELARRLPGLRIIAMSGGAGAFPDYLPAARHLGAKLALAKPFSADQLLEAVRSVLGDEA